MSTRFYDTDLTDAAWALPGWGGTEYSRALFRSSNR